MSDEQILGGGLANIGQVVRRGDTVERPAPPHAAALHASLRALRDAGFDGVPEPLKLSGKREVLSFVHGDVAIPPYPSWSQEEDVLASVGRLLRRMHEASAAIPLPDATWPTEFADPEAADAPNLVLCHNDACPENIVFRDGEAAALIDFDFAAPGRPVWDLATSAGIGPDGPAGDRRRGGFDGMNSPARAADHGGRLRTRRGRPPHAAGTRSPSLVDDDETFMTGRVAAGDPVFTEVDRQARSAALRQDPGLARRTAGRLPRGARHRGIGTEESF